MPERDNDLSHASRKNEQRASVLTAYFVFQPLNVGNSYDAASHFDEAITMQTSQVARNQFAHGSDARGELFVVFVEFKVNRGSVAFSSFSGKTEKVADQTSAHSGKGQLFHQLFQATQTVAEYFDNFYRDFGLLQAHTAKVFSIQSQQYGGFNHQCRYCVAAPIEHGYFGECVTGSLNANQLLAPVRGGFQQLNATFFHDQQLSARVSLRKDCGVALVSLAGRTLRNGSKLLVG